MGKYEPLSGFLRRQAGTHVTMTFQEIEEVIGTSLPHSARNHRAWWSNNPSNSVITAAWLEAGFESEQVDMAGERLVFRRRRKPSGRREEMATDDRGLSKPPLFGFMKGTLQIAPGVDLTAPADPGWGSDT